MIAKLTGTISDIFDSFVVIDVNGVGYKVSIPSMLLNKTTVGEKVAYYIYTVVKEDAFDLYGFIGKIELTFFQLLLSVSNIGPKTALSVMNLGSVEEIIKAISAADADFFLKVPRVGRKNAQRIIVDLRSKVGALGEIDLTFAQKEENKQLVLALESFGFKRDEIEKVLRQLPPQGTVEDKIKYALKNLGRIR